MKALEKDRTRRYGSASELAADIQRHLRDEPVLAGPAERGVPRRGSSRAAPGRRRRRGGRGRARRLSSAVDGGARRSASRASGTGRVAKPSGRARKPRPPSRCRISSQGCSASQIPSRGSREPASGRAKILDAGAAIRSSKRAAGIGRSLQARAPRARWGDVYRSLGLYDSIAAAAASGAGTGDPAAGAPSARQHAGRTRSSLNRASGGVLRRQSVQSRRRRSRCWRQGAGACSEQAASAATTPAVAAGVCAIPGRPCYWSAGRCSTRPSGCLERALGDPREPACHPISADVARSAQRARSRAALAGRGDYAEGRASCSGANDRRSGRRRWASNHPESWRRRAEQPRHRASRPRGGPAGARSRCYERAARDPPESAPGPRHPRRRGRALRTSADVRIRLMGDVRRGEQSVRRQGGGDPGGGARAPGTIRAWRRRFNWPRHRCARPRSRGDAAAGAARCSAAVARDPRVEGARSA